MLEVVGSSLAKAVAMIGTGVAFGVGFWVAKKMTNKIDEVLILRDASQVAGLANGVVS